MVVEKEEEEEEDRGCFVVVGRVAKVRGEVEPPSLGAKSPPLLWRNRTPDLLRVSVEGVTARVGQAMAVPRNGRHR